MHNHLDKYTEQILAGFWDGLLAFYLGKRLPKRGGVQGKLGHWEAKKKQPPPAQSNDFFWAWKIKSNLPVVFFHFW